MTIFDIKDLTRRLLTDPTLGWSDEPTLLAKFLGFSAFFALKNRVFGDKRIYLPEQQRMSAGLEKIARGEVICVRRLFQGEIVGEIRVCEHPKPLGWATAMRCAVKVTKTGVKLSFLDKPLPQASKGMPNFRSLMCRS